MSQNDNFPGLNKLFDRQVLWVSANEASKILNIGPIGDHWIYMLGGPLCTLVAKEAVLDAHKFREDSFQDEQITLRNLFRLVQATLALYNIRKGTPRDKSFKFAEELSTALRRVCPPSFTIANKVKKVEGTNKEKVKTVSSMELLSVVLKKLTPQDVFRISKACQKGVYGLLCHLLLCDTSFPKIYLDVCSEASRGCKRLHPKPCESRIRKLVGVVSEFGIDSVRSVFQKITPVENAFSEEQPCFIDLKKAFDEYVLYDNVSAVSYRHRRNFTGRDRTSEKQKRKARVEGEDYIWIDKNIRGIQSDDEWFRVGLLPYIVLNMRNLDDKIDLKRPWILLEYICGRRKTGLFEMMPRNFQLCMIGLSLQTGMSMMNRGIVDIFQERIAKIISFYFFDQIPIDPDYEYFGSMHAVFTSMFSDAKSLRQSSLISNDLSPVEIGNLLKTYGSFVKHVEQWLDLDEIPVQMFGMNLPDGTFPEVFGSCSYKDENVRSWILFSNDVETPHINLEYTPAESGQSSYSAQLTLLYSHSCMNIQCEKNHKIGDYFSDYFYRQLFSFGKDIAYKKATYLENCWIYYSHYMASSPTFGGGYIVELSEGLVLPSYEVKVIDGKPKLGVCLTPQCPRQHDNNLDDSAPVFMEANDHSVLSDIRNCIIGTADLSSMFCRASPSSSLEKTTLTENGTIDIYAECLVPKNCDKVVAVLPLNRAFTVKWITDQHAVTERVWSGRLFSETQHKKLLLTLNLQSLDKKRGCSV